MMLAQRICGSRTHLLPRLVRQRPSYSPKNIVVVHSVVAAVPTSGRKYIQTGGFVRCYLEDYRMYNSTAKLSVVAMP